MRLNLDYYEATTMCDLELCKLFDIERLIRAWHDNPLSFLALYGTCSSDHPANDDLRILARVALDKVYD